MKSTFNLITGILLFAQISYAKPVISNCYGEMAQYFVHELEDIATDGATPVLLFNESKEVVGVISVSPERSTQHSKTAANVVVNKMELCGSLEVDSFYYADDLAANLLNWAGAETDSIEITQDEGRIVLNAKVVKKESYSTLVKVNFKAYDVFTDEESDDEENEWGPVKGEGTFYFYTPKNWVK